MVEIGQILTDDAGKRFQVVQLGASSVYLRALDFEGNLVYCLTQSAVNQLHKLEV